MIFGEKRRWKTAKNKDIFKLTTPADHRDLLRFTTAGSVDDGKSTLIGRLLLDSDNIYEDQLSNLAASSEKRGLDFTDLSLVTDGLKDEREQGITIDVAHRFFSTNKRKFIMADVPGHLEYTRNMITGASNSNLAILLIDVRNGVVEQTKRHAFISSLLGIKHLIVCVNKMDLVNYSEDSFSHVVSQFQDFASKLDIEDIRFIPVSALNGDNVVERSEKIDWYNGSTLLYTLENIHVSSDRNLIDCRFPIQTVIRPKTAEHSDFRGYAGRVESGMFKVGDEVVSLPQGTESTIKEISTAGRSTDFAVPPMSVCINLKDYIDLSRGNMLVRKNNQPKQVTELEFMMCYLGNNQFKTESTYSLLHTTSKVQCKIEKVYYKVDIHSLHRNTEDTIINSNEIARIKVKCSAPLFVDAYSRNKATGSVLLVDEETNNTVAAGMIL
jgi:sulfate adenylyltransferase subunit 1